MTGTEIWKEPVRGSFADPSILGLTGLERMKAAVRRAWPPPPIHHLTGLVPTQAGVGTCTFTMPASPWLLTPAGYFAAGAIAFLADAPLGGAVLTSLPPGKLLATSDLTMNFLRGVGPFSRQLVGKARLIHSGRSLGLAEGTFEDAAGRLVAHGTTRCFIFDGMTPVPDPPTSLDEIPPVAYPEPDPYLRPVAGEVMPQEIWDRMSGLEVLQGQIDGEIPRPPVYYLTGQKPIEVRDGYSVFSMPASGWLSSPATFVYGGAIAMLADAALATSVQTTIPPRTVCSPLDLKVNFLRPVMPDGGTLTARATVCHRGRSLAVSNAEIVNEEGKTIATATESVLILPNREWSAPIVASDEMPVPEIASGGGGGEI